MGGGADERLTMLSGLEYISHVIFFFFFFFFFFFLLLLLLLLLFVFAITRS